MNGRAASIIALTLALVAFAPVRVSAYRTGADLLERDPRERVAWKGPVAIRLNDEMPEGIDSSVVENLLVEQIESWTASRCGEDLLAYDDRIAEKAEPGDGISTVQWVFDDWTDLAVEDAAAVTDVQYEKRGDSFEIVEADIYLNADSLMWLDLGEGPVTTGAQLSIVLRHELGHVLGLAHPCEIDGPVVGVPSCDDGEAPRSLMHPLYAESAVAQASGPSSDDVAGICFLYGSAEAENEGADGGERMDAVDAGAEATASDGGAVPGDIGDVCQTSDDCRGMQCVVGYSGDCGGICTRSCDATDPCPYGYECSPVAERFVCVPRAEEESGGICAVLRPARASRAPVWVGMTALLSLLIKRRRRIAG